MTAWLLTIWSILSPAQQPLAQMIPEGSFQAGGYYAKEMRWARPHAGVLAFTSDPAPKTGVLRSTPFRLPSKIHFFTVGFLSHAGFRIYLIDEATKSTLDLRTRIEPGMTWREHFWSIPSDWVGATVRLVAEDNATGGEDWMGITAPEAGGEPLVFSLFRAIYRTGTFLYFAILFLLPGLAAAILLSRKIKLTFIQLVPAIFCGSGLAAYLAFWMYLARPGAGKWFSIVVVILSGGYVLFSHKFIRLMPAIRETAVCLALTMLVGVFYCSVGYLYNTDDAADAYVQNRFSTGFMPPDNNLPFLLAGRLDAGASLKQPLVAIWQTSDRPPLQSGATLMMFPFANLERQLAYELLCVFLQCLWLPGLWILLRGAGLSNKYLIPIFAFAILSELCLFHSFYVWPKLFGAGFVLMAFGLVLRNEWKTVDAAVCVACLSLGFLSHSGVAFTIIPVAVFALATRRLPGWKNLGVGLAIGLLFLLPWRWYQSVCDPPGDNLLKLSLADIRSDEDYKVPFGKLLAESYSRTSADKYVSNKIADVKTLFTGPEWDGLVSGNLSKALGSFGNGCFFHLFWTLGLLNAGFICRYYAKPTAARRFADQCMWTMAGAIVLWIFVMFPESATVIHQWSLANVLILFVALVIYIIEGYPQLLYPLLALQALVVFPLIAFAKPWMEAIPGAVMDAPVDPGMAICAVAAIAAIAYVGWRAIEEPQHTVQQQSPTLNHEIKQQSTRKQSPIMCVLITVVSRHRWELLGASLLLLFLIRTAWCGEDAYIAFRVVANFLSGYGLTWNVGDRVQAYTDPLFEFLIIIATLITKDPYWSSILVSLLLSISMYFLLMRDRSGLTILMGTTIFLNAKGFMDFSVSGLENPATHLAIIAFVLLYWKKRNVFGLTLIAALAAVNRMDSVLLFVPSLLWLYYRTGWRAWKSALLGATPFLAWEAFAIFYYGFPFPNTAYAKLNTGIPPMELAFQGIHYIQNAISWDTVTVLTIVGGTIVGFLGKDWPLALGACLSMIYVVRVGGDYMAGRFITPAFVLCCALLIQHTPKNKRYALTISGVALLFGLLLISPPLLTTREFGAWRPDSPGDYRGIEDERALLYHGSGLLKWRPGILWPDDQWVQEGVKMRDSGIRFRELNNIGMIPYFAGPNVYFYDSGALADALSARLPMKSGPWKTGHYWRDPPAGYVDTLKTGVNQIQDPNLREYYEHLRKITRGDLWDPSRWKEIVLMNCGVYDRLLHQSQPAPKPQPSLPAGFPVQLRHGSIRPALALPRNRASWTVRVPSELS